QRQRQGRRGDLSGAARGWCGAGPDRDTSVNPRSAAKAIRVLLPVWGDEFIGRFLDHSLPKPLARGNIPALSEALPTRFVFLTRVGRCVHSRPTRLSAPGAGE